MGCLRDYIFYLCYFTWTYYATGIIRNDQEGLDVMVLQVSVAKVTVPRLNLIVLTEAAQGLFRDVNASVDNDEI